jgi:hypothetical protein
MYLPFVFMLGWPNSSTRLSYGIGLVNWFAAICVRVELDMKTAAPQKGYLLEFTAFIKILMIEVRSKDMGNWEVAVAVAVVGAERDDDKPD